RFKIVADFLSSALRYALRELIARPSDSRTIGQPTISTGMFKSRTMANQHQLYGIFLAEKSDVGLNDVKELGDDGRNSAKVAGARAAIELIAQAFNRDPRHHAARVHFTHGWHEKKINSFIFQQFAISFECPRILREVFVGAELCRVHKDRG